MTFESTTIELIIQVLETNFYILSFIGATISTNIFVFFIATLAGQGILDLWKVWIVAVIGILISDFMWFNLGKTNLINKIVSHRHFIYNYYSIKYLLSKYEEKGNFFVFLTSKFVYGLKVLTLMYAGRREMSLKDLLKYDFPSSIIWSTFLVSFGFVIGSGLTKIAESLNDIKWATAILSITIILIYIIWFISGRMIKKNWEKLTWKLDRKMIVPKMKYYKLINRFS